MKTNLKKVLSIVMILTMVFAMSATAFASQTITPQPVTYPINATVVFISEGDVVTDSTGDVHQTAAAYAEVPVTFTAPFTTVFTKYLNTVPASGAHQLEGYPTVMDAICQAYMQDNGSMSGFSIGWDSNPYEGPQGAYVNTIYGNSTITTVSGLYRWEGYSWSIYLNVTDEWNEDAQTGKIPYYASNVQLHDNDIIYVLYEENVETW